MFDWDYIKKLGGEGILRRQDVADLKHARAKVLWLMLDGEWHQATQIIDASGTREGLRRLRELRDIPGAIVERQVSYGREFKYRLRFETAQREMF
jgi:hypothetical protein